MQYRSIYCVSSYRNFSLAVKVFLWDFGLLCVLASGILLLVFSFDAFQKPICWKDLNFTKSAPSGAPPTGHQFGEFVVMSLRTYGNSLISTCSILYANNDNNDNNIN